MDIVEDMRIEHVRLEYPGAAYGSLLPGAGYRHGPGSGLGRGL
jgi:hypothetical protein